MPRPVPLLLPLAFVALSGCAALGAGPPEARAPHPVRAEGRFVYDEDGLRVGGFGLRVVLAGRTPGGRWEALAPPVETDEQGRFALAATADLGRYDSLAAFALADAVAVRFSPRPSLRLRAAPSASGVGPSSAGPGAAPEAGRAFALGARVAVGASGDAASGAAHASGGVDARGLGGTLPREVGVTARWAAMGRETALAVYGGSLPFALPPARVTLRERGGFRFQPFDPGRLGGTEIELNAARRITPAIVAHEYGHYASYRMWGADWWRYSLRKKHLREGWAMFFSLAVRAYAARAYGDAQLAESNVEAAPWTHLLGSPRYERTSYGRSHPEYVAVGALLWSLYDGAHPSPLEPEALGFAGDNDDVSGQAVRVFEAVRRTRGGLGDRAGITDVIATFRGAAPEALRASVDAAADFFLCPAFPACDFKAAPDARTETATPSLRPAPPLALAARRGAGGAVLLRWQPAAPAAYWGNPPEAWRLLRDGEPLATLGPAETAYEDEGARGPHVYEVRAVGGGGVSATGAVARVGPAP